MKQKTISQKICGCIGGIIDMIDNGNHGSSYDIDRLAKLLIEADRFESSKAKARICQVESRKLLKQIEALLVQNW